MSVHDGPRAEAGRDPLADAHEPPKGFHLRDGFYFRRLDDGTISVEVWRHTSRYHVGSPVEGWYRSEAMLTTVDGIASAMASVSRRGENNQTFGEAVRFLSASTAPEPFGPPAEGAIQRRCWTISEEGGAVQCERFNGHGGDHQFGSAAAALDVERLARALHSYWHEPKWESHADALVDKQHHDHDAKAIATVYARLAAEEAADE